MHYRDTLIWNKAMDLAALACDASALLPMDQKFGIRLQITRSSVSVASNIAEGWARESRKEKAQFLAIAHGSLAELHTQILLSVRVGWLRSDGIKSLLNEIDEVSRILTVLRRQFRAA